jgi:hypothetical protein
MKIIQNSIITPDGTILISHTVHDFVSHDDANGTHYFVDGGEHYIRIGGNNDYKDNFVFEDTPFEIARERLSWGTRGKNGKRNLKFVLIKDLTTDHIQAIIETQNQISDYYKRLFLFELNLRKEA